MTTCQKHAILLFTLAFFAASSAVLGHQAAKSQKKPNIVLILADDLGWGDLTSYNRDSKVQTPHLDQLAAEGMRFTDAHTASAVCTPTRYALLTGRYAWRTRLKSGVLWGYSPPLLEHGRANFASLLQEQRYVTGCIGKWHLGLGWATRQPADFGDLQKPAADPQLVNYGRPVSYGPQTAGFHYSFILPASLDMEPYVWVENNRPIGPVTGRIAAGVHQRQGGRGFWREGPISPGFTHENCQPTLLEKAERFIDQQSSDRPFLLYFPLTSPHDPWVPTAEFRGRSAAGDRGDFVAQVDATVGRLAAMLEKKGLAKETLFIFTSDNGAHWLPPEAERTGHRANGPWRGMKSDAFEGGHRVPLIVRWPGKVQAGSVSDSLVGLVDMIATFAEIAGAGLPAGAGEDSISFLPALQGRSQARPPLVMHSINGVFAIRSGEWKFIESNGSGGWTKDQVPEEAQLYNLRDDPGEERNLYSSQKGRAAALRAELNKLRR